MVLGRELTTIHYKSIKIQNPCFFLFFYHKTMTFPSLYASWELCWLHHHALGGGDLQKKQNNIVSYFTFSPAMEQNLRVCFAHIKEEKCVMICLEQISSGWQKWHHSHTVSPITIGCGSLFTPTPALVPAATSTLYCTPACRPPTTTERMAASTVLFTWKRLSFPRHQI